MSGRGASAGVLTEIGKSANKPFHLVDVAFDANDGGTVRLCDSYRSIVWNGNTYPALGHFLDYSQIEESSELRVTQAALTLSGVDQTWIAELLIHKYLGRTCTVYKAFFDANEVLLVDPFPVCQGPMDAPVVDEDPTNGTCTIAIQVTSLGADIDRIAGRRTSLADQQRFFPNDTGFKFTPQVSGLIAGRQVYWGRPGIPPA